MRNTFLALNRNFPSGTDSESESELKFLLALRRRTGALASSASDICRVGVVGRRRLRPGSIL